MTLFLLFQLVCAGAAAFCALWCGVFLAMLPNVPKGGRAGEWRQVRRSGGLCLVAFLPVAWLFWQGAV
jgi:hypothetical protein